MYLGSRRKKRRSSPLRVLILLVLIGAGIYVYLQVEQQQVENPFVPTPTPTRSASSYVSEAEDWYWRGDLTKAIAAYEQAIALDPDNVEPYIPLARLLTLEGRTIEAVQRAKQAVEMTPKNARAWAVLGMAYDWSGDVTRAIDACKQAIELDPAYAEGYAYLAEAYADAGRWTEAKEQAQTALDLDDGHSVDAHRNYGYVLENLGRYWEALEEYKRALEIHPNLAYIHIAVGKNYLALGNFNAAMQSFQQAVKVDPDNAEAYYRLGRAYYNSEEYEEAETYLKQAIEADAEFGPAFGHLAFTYWSRRNYEDAIPNLELAIALECIAARRQARTFFVTVEKRRSEITRPSTDPALNGDFAPTSEDKDTLQATLKPRDADETWTDARGTVTLDTRSGKYTVTLKSMPRIRYNQTYVGWFEGVDTLSGDPLNTGPLNAKADGSVEAELEATWVEGPRIEYFYTLGLAHFYMAECEKSYPLFNAALQIDPEDENALEGIRLCKDAEAEE